MVEIKRKPDVAEVLVVGAGASGSIAVKHLAEAGFKVVCLEQGHEVDTTEFYGDKPEWEIMNQKRWHPNPNVRQRSDDYPVDTDGSEVNPLMYNAVGGSSVLYAAHWHRFAPSDFRVKSMDCIADDWPITYEDLEPFYDVLDVEMGVSGLGGDPAMAPATAPPLPPLPIGKVGRKAATGMNKLGWHWWPGVQAIPSRAYRGRSQCARRGTCMSGCPEQAKGSMDITHWPDALKFGAKLITGARVERITVDKSGMASGAIYVDRNGIRHEQRAEIVLICCNGVGTPRLLLNSANNQHPDGLANSSGVLGRNLMMHPFAVVMGSFDEDLESWLGPNGQCIYSMQFYETDTNRGFVRGAKWNAQGTGGPLGFRSALGGAPLEEIYGEGIHRQTRQRLGRSIEWGIVAEDLPDLDNTVTLATEMTDSDGIPAPKITYRNSENTKRMIDFHVDHAKQALEAAGAYELSSTKLMTDCGWHLMGTARMGNDPGNSVVDSNCRSHDIPNLYILDGSVFVTSSGFNPTATICALALRAVYNIIENRATLRRAS